MSMSGINVPRRLLLGSTAAAAAGGLLTGFGTGSLRAADAQEPQAVSTKSHYYITRSNMLSSSVP